VSGNLPLPLPQLEISMLAVRNQQDHRDERQKDQEELMNSIRQIAQNTQQLSSIARNPNDAESVMRTIQEVRLIDVSVDTTC
jgi:hypothetical protein